MHILAWAFVNLALWHRILVRNNVSYSMVLLRLTDLQTDLQAAVLIVVGLVLLGVYVFLTPSAKGGGKS